MDVLNVLERWNLALQTWHGAQTKKYLFSQQVIFSFKQIRNFVWQAEFKCGDWEKFRIFSSCHKQKMIVKQWFTMWSNGQTFCLKQMSNVWQTKVARFAKGFTTVFLSAQYILSTTNANNNEIFFIFKVAAEFAWDEILSVIFTSQWFRKIVDLRDPETRKMSGKSCNISESQDHWRLLPSLILSKLMNN